MNKEVNLNAIKEYEKIFGPDKMRLLWQEFLVDSAKKLEMIELKEPAEIRLAFHSLRSSSLVFGMVAFAKDCAEIENAVLQAQDSAILKKHIDKSKKIFDNSKRMVAEFFE